MVTTSRAVVCLFVWLSVCQVRGAYISEKMNETIRNLLQYYNISNVQRFDGKPVFSRELIGGVEENMVLMGGVLDTYEKLFHHMLKNLPTPSPQLAPSGTASNAEKGADSDVKTALEYLLKMVGDLKKSHYQKQGTLLKRLHDISRIKMEERVVQSKALGELTWFFEEAHSLQHKRKRRHARRVKTNRRA
ncbi:interferon gamma-like [Thunnus thynnus]|uniref:interferon gamma-like n=1 Tax=Thunnus thynnus TaxID=8237 RepID=UPI00352998C8